MHLTNWIHSSEFAIVFIATCLFFLPNPKSLQNWSGSPKTYLRRLNGLNRWRTGVGNALPATGQCHRGSWAGRSTLERCPTREAASPLLSCRTMASPCNQWAGKDRENKRISLCHRPNTCSADCIFKQSCCWKSKTKHVPGLTGPG